MRHIPVSTFQNHASSAGLFTLFAMVSCCIVRCTFLALTSSFLFCTLFRNFLLLTRMIGELVMQIEGYGDTALDTFDSGDEQLSCNNKNYQI